MNKVIGLGLVMALGISAVETRDWRQTDFADFEKGSLKRLSLGSEGSLSLAPVVKELFDPSTGYLWTVAQDSKGNLYSGGGSTTGTTARLYRVDTAGQSTVVAELEGLEIHAIAIDTKDEVYAATAPDGKVYRVRNGKAEVFFDPKTKYIWQMVFGPGGDLFIGTGDKGEIWRVKRDGQGSIFFRTDETHARSLAIDAQGSLIVGTEPSGLVLRVSPAGQGFVLHQTAKREVTAVTVAKDGSIYAAAVGNRIATITPPAVPVPAPASTPPGAGAIVLRPSGTAVPAAPAVPVPPAIVGGSEIYKIDLDGAARRIWSHATDLAYSIALDAKDRLVVATGNRGGLYRLSANQHYTLLANLAPTQVTQLISSKSGAMYAVTGNIGKLYQVGPSLEHDGVFESDVLDAGAFTYWGRLAYEGGAGPARLETRSGNLNDSHKNWSEWAAAGADGRVQSPAARFLQYKLTLGQSSDGSSPEVTAVDLKFQAKNIAPVVEQVEVTPPNYKFPAPATPATPSPASLTLPAIGQKRSRARSSSGPSDGGSASSLSYLKGFASVRWAASDDNSDALVFKIEIRGARETGWKLLRDKIREHYYSWDSTAFADGEYVVRVTASDSPSNTPEEALSAMYESAPFLIDNSPPEIQGLMASANGSRVAVSFKAKDALSNIARAEYSINGGEWTVAQPTTRLSDAKELSYQLNIPRGASAGEFTVAVRVTDEFDNQSVAKAAGK